MVFNQAVIRILRKGERRQPQGIQNGQGQPRQIGGGFLQIAQIVRQNIMPHQPVRTVRKVFHFKQGFPEAFYIADGALVPQFQVRTVCAKFEHGIRFGIDLQIDNQNGGGRRCHRVSSTNESVKPKI